MKTLYFDCFSGISGDMTIGAPIDAVPADEFYTLSAMTVQLIGYGAGTKSFPNHPNVLRVIIGE